MVAFAVTMPIPAPRRSIFAAFSVGVVALVCACVGCTPLVPRYDYELEPDPTRLEYVLGPGDVIDIRQWKNPDVSGRVRVFPDGNIAVPLLGQVQAAGLTARQLRDKLAKGLEKYIAQSSDMPTLTVAVDEFQSYAISVVGEVAQPGHYQPGHYVTVLEAVSLAHGLTPYGKGEKMFVLRRASAAQRKIPISYPALLAGKHPEMNVYLMRGDVLVVP